MIRLRVLGPLELHDGHGRELRAVIAQPRRFGLLTYLSASPAQAFHRRDTLLGLFWPELDVAHARAALNQAIRFLRKALDDDAQSLIVSRGAEEVGIDRAMVWCDAATFREHLDAGRHADALDLYRGDLLDGFFLDGADGFEAWVERERFALRREAAHAARALGEQYERERDFTAAVACARRAVDLSGLDELRVRELLELMDRLGDRAGALQVFDRFAGKLTEEFGAEPSPETKRVIDRIRARAIARDVTAPARLDAVAAAVPFNGDATVRPAEAPRETVGPTPAHTDRSQGTAASVSSAGRQRALSVFLVAGSLIVAVLVVSAWWYSTASSRPPRDASVVAVLPFRVTSSDSANNYLREGVVDLLSAFLNGDGAPRAIDTRVVLGAYARERAKTSAELTTGQMLTVARRLGAGRMLTGEIVVAPGDAAMSARILDVPSGRVVAQHIERGDGDYVRLATRVASALLAKSFGEATSRVALLSDSTEAVREYLAGMRAYRNLDARAAFDHLSRALEIDRGFGLAALWRAYVAWGAFTFGTAEKRSADSAAWALRGRLARRDSLVLVSLPSIGPNYPAPSTARDIIRAQERAARANPDRAEVWTAWANHLITFGTQADIENCLDVAESVIDSAIAIDSTFLPALGIRMQIALRKRDRVALRERADRYFNALGDSGAPLHWQYAVANVLGDSTRLPSILARLAEAPGFAWQNIELWSLNYGFSSVRDADRIAELRLARARMPAERTAAMRSLMRVAGVRGRARAALAWADSIGEGASQPVITLSILGDGYDSAAASRVRAMEARLASAERRAPEDAAHSLCYTQLYRIVHRDTSGTRRAVDRMRELTSAIDAAPGWRVSRLDLCGLLLEAALEQQRKPPASRSPALDRVERLVRQGPQAEQPGNLSRLLIAAWREAQGDYRAALAVLRGRDPMAWHVTAPASWRAEGRLAALTGDTAGAVRAYRNYLVLRDQPDPGAIADEVRQVRAELARLERDRTRTR